MKEIDEAIESFERYNKDFGYTKSTNTALRALKTMKWIGGRNNIECEECRWHILDHFKEEV